ncbi:MAG: hypothetical protein HXY34_07780 [Candidatus Thorarchaeota archaeon]|nr:hypothetical protein [Candidatus Thorarchaeota archaeon]
MTDHRRLALPIIYCVTGVIATLYWVYYLLFVFQDIPTLDLVPVISGGVARDVTLVLAAVIPVTLVLYLLLSLPMSAVYILVLRLIRGPSYDLSIVQTGESFSGTKILKRVAVPALFSITSARLILALLPDLLFSVPSVLFAPAFVGRMMSFEALFFLVGSLGIAWGALVLFTPTWVLNDAGVVINLKTSALKSRVCPDVQGVGLWFSRFLGGYSILGYPITSLGVVIYGRFLTYESFSIIALLNSIAFIAMVPLLVMAFLVPVALLNELLLRVMTKYVRRVAVALGGKMTAVETVAPVE